MKKVKRTKKLFQTRKSPLSTFVYKHFVTPVEEIFKLSKEDALSLWLGIKSRDIYFCKAELSFKMMGKEMFHPNPKSKYGRAWQDGTMNRDVKRGQSIIVRIDKRTPDRIDVDLNLGEEVRTFVLSNAEYELLREKVEVLY